MGSSVTKPPQAATAHARDPWLDIPQLLTLQSNLGAIANLPLLSPEEEVELAKTAEAGALAEDALTCANGDPVSEVTKAELRYLASEGRAAFQRIVLSNTRLVAWMARRRLISGTYRLTYAELFQEGLIGLVRAAHKWDYRRGLKFSTYAVYWIRATQQRAERRARGVSENVAGQQAAIRRARNDLAGELGRAPTEDEVAARVGLSPRRISQLEAARAAEEHSTSLDAHLGEASRATWHDTIADTSTADPATELAALEEHEALRTHLRRLPRRQQTVLAMHFGLNGHEAADIETIARRCRVPASRAAATLEAALTTLRETLREPWQDAG